MISASKTTFSHYILKILRPKVMKNLTNLPKKFCEFQPCFTLVLLGCSKVAITNAFFTNTLWLVSPASFEKKADQLL